MSTTDLENVLGIALLSYLISSVVAAIVMFRRSQQVVRCRVEATERPVSGAFVCVYFAWSLIKGYLWPLTLAIWIALGRPEPGTLRRPDASHTPQVAPGY